MWEAGSGETQVHGLWMYRPTETYHLPTRKFLEKEVFRSDFSDTFPLSKVLGKCFVMSVKEYFKFRPMVRNLNSRSNGHFFLLCL